MMVRRIMDQKRLPINQRILVGTPIGIFQTMTKRNSLKKHFTMSTKMKKITGIQKMMKMKMIMKIKKKMKKTKTIMTMTMRRRIDSCFSNCLRFPRQRKRLSAVNTKKKSFISLSFCIFYPTCQLLFSVIKELSRIMLIFLLKQSLQILNKF